MSELIPWALFLLFVITLLALDLGVFHRDAHAVSRKEAGIWSVVWISIALTFNAGVYLVSGTDRGIEWTTGYLIEKSLAVDNIFIFLLIFATFRVPAAYQHRVLFWGILGALVMRAALILFAGFLIGTLHWVIYVFGAFLIFTGIRFLREQDEEPDLENSRIVRWTKRLFPFTAAYEGQRFFIRREGTLVMTPLFLVLVLVETSDLIFAVDSIPAIYAITDDPFTVFTSNILAILGLRSLYFVLAGYLQQMHYLKPALAGVLVFVGTKMLVADIYHLPPFVSLAVIIGILTIAVVASLLHPKPEAEMPPERVLPEG